MSIYHDEIEIEDMEYDDDTETYYYPCPCGDRFQITKEELESGEDVAKCPSCSLLIKVIYDPDSPGGSTPRGTPVRMTPVLTRGNQQSRVSHSSCLLEEVLAEKKMDLMRSPEVVQWLQDFQQQIQHQEGGTSTDTEMRGISESDDRRTRMDDRLQYHERHHHPVDPDSSSNSQNFAGQSAVDEYSLAVNNPHHTQDFDTSDGDIRMMSENSTSYLTLTRPVHAASHTPDVQYVSQQLDQSDNLDILAAQGPGMYHVERMAEEEGVEEADHSRSHLVTQWLNANVHPIQHEDHPGNTNSQHRGNQGATQIRIPMTDNNYKIS